MPAPVAPPATAAPPSVAAAPVAVPDSVRLRLTARGRLVIAGLMLLVATALGSAAGLAVSATADPPTAVEMVTVGGGDSLWSIAAEVTAPGGDVRETMAQIVALNELQGSVLNAGQVLTIPSSH
ncbi:MAG: LysM peptidoglycan-binding domain-containing protein [Beutenbergiaceae bacterium]